MGAYKLTPQQEIIDAIEILIKKAMENITRIVSGTVRSVNVDKSTCEMTIDGKTYDSIVYYGSQPMVNRVYRVFIPDGNMSRAFVMVV